MDKLTIATRGSKLALWQANHIKDLLAARHPGLAVELLVIKTTGDKILDAPLAKIGGKGLFVKEIEEALLSRHADLAVHSMKDVPVELPAELVVGVHPEREKPTDTLLSAQHASLADLPPRARVGTSSLRRKTQLLALRPDLEVLDLRGNVDTRLRKLLEGRFDAIVMATAGLRRLGLSAPMMSELGPPDFLPAVAQGALGIEYRRDDPAIAQALAFLDHPETHTCVAAERGFLTGLDGGCQVPIAAHATLEGDTVRLAGLLADLDGGHAIRRSITGPAARAFELGLSLADTVLTSGGAEILDKIYSDSGQ